MSRSLRTKSLLWATALSVGLSVLTVPSAHSQTQIDTNRPLKLASDSPYRDPDIIYLEADELINDESNQILTAKGQVEGRYQDRTLRADAVVYDLKTGRVIASGNVALIDASGSVQYAEKLELSNELEAGTAANFTSRFENGGITGAAIATRREDGGIDLYNAYYTACEPCEGKKPTWQIKARRVSQDPERNMIRYQDAVFEFLGLPFFYTPYLAHADPTAGRASGWLSPYVGLSSSKGLNVRAPYYVAVSPYSELTITPRLFQKVNPVLGYEYRRKFYSGEVNIDGSITYGSFFNRDGDPFVATNTFNRPDLAPLGKRVRSHFFADGLFDLNDTWDWGFGVQLTSDDLYLNRYDFEENPEKFGLYDGDGRRLVSQLFATGQDDSFRFSTSAFGFQSLRTTIREDAADPNNFLISVEDDSTLPIIAPKIELSKFFTDPVIGGRLQAFGDVTVSNRKLGTDYTRLTGGLEWSKTFITPGGIEAKPFAEARYDHFDFAPENANKVKFDRSVGQVGVDVRWPFMRAGQDVDVIIEPRVQLTQNFGSGEINNFNIIDNTGTPVSLFQDSIDIDFDQSLFWSPNKSTGFDRWQKGFRADVGGSVTALWDKNRATAFVGQSYASDFETAFTGETGLEGDKSDIVGLFELDLNGKFKTSTRLRYDDDANRFRRIDTGFSFNHKRIKTDVRYYNIHPSAINPLTNADTPAEQISGGVTLKLTDNWSTRYRAYHDISSNVTRRQDLSLIFQDDCTLIEFVYNENNFNNDAVRSSSGFGIRVSLLTLGEIDDN